MAEEEETLSLEREQENSGMGKEKLGLSGRESNLHWWWGEIKGKWARRKAWGYNISGREEERWEDVRRLTCDLGEGGKGEGSLGSFSRSAFKNWIWDTVRAYIYLSAWLSY